MPSFFGNAYHCVGAPNRRFGREKKTREDFFVYHLNASERDSAVCRSPYGIDLLQTPTVMKCRSCGVEGVLSNAEIRWPSGQVKPKRLKKCRSALPRILSLTMILIFVFIVMLALTDRLPLGVGLPKPENAVTN